VPLVEHDPRHGRHELQRTTNSEHVKRLSNDKRERMTN
jgi:hypothetical protein